MKPLQIYTFLLKNTIRNYNKEILTIKKSHEEKKEEDIESYIDKLQFQLKNLDLNKMISGNHND
jgi:hypothetical protein